MFKLWGIKKISNMNSANRTLEKIGSSALHQGSYKDSDEEGGGLPESGDDDDMLQIRKGASN